MDKIALLESLAAAVADDRYVHNILAEWNAERTPRQLHAMVMAMAMIEDGDSYLLRPNDDDHPYFVILAPRIARLLGETLGEHVVFRSFERADQYEWESEPTA